MGNESENKERGKKRRVKDEGNENEERGMEKLI